MILGLDPSLSVTGWALLPALPTGPEIIDSGTIETIGVRADRLRRLRDVTAAFAKLFQRVQRDHGLTIIVIEGYAFVPGSSAVSVLAEVGGIARGLAGVYAQGAVDEVMPAVWKRAMIGSLPKQSAKNIEAYLSAVRERYGLKFKTTHEADAWMLAAYWKGKHPW